MSKLPSVGLPVDLQYNEHACICVHCVAGSPPLGSRGTVVGVHEGALEVLFDADFIGGGDLQGRCQGRCGTMLPPADLLNLAKPHFINLQGGLTLSKQSYMLLPKARCLCPCSGLTASQATPLLPLPGP